jgi:hypothetical protein
MILTLILSSMIGATINQEPMPSWCIPGICFQETRSFYDPLLNNGQWVYVDRKRGAAHERGIAQVTPNALTDVRHIWQRIHPGLRKPTSADLDDPDKCIEVATVYLRYCLLPQTGGNWLLAIAAYNVGASGLKDRRADAARYLSLVNAYGIRVLERKLP